MQVNDFANDFTGPLTRAATPDGSQLSRFPAVSQNQRAITVIRWLFYAFIFSLTFETAGEDIGLIEPPTVVGGLLVLSTLLQPGLFLRWPPKSFWCFIVYFYLFVTLGLLEPAAYRSMFVHDATVLLQLTVLAWLAFNLMRDRATAERALLTLAIACTVLAVLQLFGFVNSAVDQKGGVARAAAFGFHPNHLARILVLGMLAIVGILYTRKQNLTRSLIIAAPFIIIIAAVLLQTGSRGAILALGAALLTFGLRKSALKNKVINIFGLLLLLGLLALAATQSDVMRSRFQETIAEGDLARREQIYPTAWEMIKEKPLVGWGPVTSIYELGMRLGHPEEETKNPHNLVLYGLVTSGVLGSFPLFLGIALAIFSAWRARHRAHGMLPLAMVIAVLAANMSGVWLFNKLHWLVMAYALASVHYEPLKEYALPRTSPKRPQVRAEGYVSA
ncbi:MAG: O-antigen ligase family protein [Acidobacteriota bacterium]